MAPEPVTSVVVTIRTEYTCPVHPELVQDSPGYCPTCGTTLEARALDIEEETRVQQSLAPMQKLVDNVTGYLKYRCHTGARWPAWYRSPAMHICNDIGLKFRFSQLQDSEKKGWPHE